MKAPGPDEQGWKDTYVMYPGEVTRVIAHFDMEGLYVWHCHILSHEDHEMMRPYYVGQMTDHNMSAAIQKTYPATEQPLNALVATPNPFRQQLELRFSLPKTSKVELRILNATGTPVKQVYGGMLSAGSHVMRVDGGGWSNGMYLCELIIDGKKQVTRAVLAR
jgi:spore coat protein A